MKCENCNRSKIEDKGTVYSCRVCQRLICGDCNGDECYDECPFCIPPELVEYDVPKQKKKKKKKI